MGYGASTVGGAGGQTFAVDTIAEFRSAVAATGPRIINVAPGLYDLGGNRLSIQNPFVTINGGGAIVKSGSVFVQTSQVIIRNLNSWSGDESGVSANDVDSFTINGNSAPIHHIVLDHVVALWGPDVSSAMLGAVSDVTIQCSILGEGLFHSRHSESQDADGHSLTLNIASTDASAFGQRITMYGDLFTTSQSRAPRIIGSVATDIIDSVFYNFAESPQGNPQSLNIIGCTWKKGPAPAAAGVPFTTLLWRYQPGGHGAFEARQDNSVYISGQQVLGYSASTPSGDNATVLRSTPEVAPSATSIGAAAAYAMVTQYAGTTSASSQLARLRSNVLNSTGTYYNGVGEAPPNPTWP